MNSSSVRTGKYRGESGWIFRPMSGFGRGPASAGVRPRQGAGLGSWPGTSAMAGEGPDAGRMRLILWPLAPTQSSGRAMVSKSSSRPAGRCGASPASAASGQLCRKTPDRNRGLKTASRVAAAAHRHGGMIGEPAVDVAVAPSAEIGRRRGQLAVVERQRRPDAAGVHPVRRPVAEVGAGRVHRAAALGHHPGPEGGEGEAVGAEVRRRDQVEILGPAVRLIAVQPAVLGLDDVAGRFGEVVPVGAAGTARAPCPSIRRAEVATPNRKPSGTAVRSGNMGNLSSAGGRWTARAPARPRADGVGAGRRGRRQGRAASRRPGGRPRAPTSAWR